MSRVEEMTAVRVAPQQAMRVLTTVARMREWMAPHVTVVPLTGAPTLAPGSRFRLDVTPGPSFEYEVEAQTDRELMFAFKGPWSGHERWSFIADGAETIVRRSYEVEDGGEGLAALAWQTVGRAIVVAHFKIELSRFREAVERSPGPLAEIEARTAPAPSQSTSYPIDEG